MDTPTLDIWMYHNDKHGIIFIHLAYKYAAHTQYILVLVIPGGGGTSIIMKVCVKNLKMYPYRMTP